VSKRQDRPIGRGACAAHRPSNIPRPFGERVRVRGRGDRVWPGGASVRCGEAKVNEGNNMPKISEDWQPLATGDRGWRGLHIRAWFVGYHPYLTNRISKSWFPYKRVMRKFSKEFVTSILSHFTYQYRIVRSRSVG
jgi:hypothetical protein